MRCAADFSHCLPHLKITVYYCRMERSVDYSIVGRLYTQHNYLAAISECFYLDSRCSIPPSIDEHISDIQKISSTLALPHQPPPIPSTDHGNKLLRDPPNLRDDERVGMSLRTWDKPSERGRLPNTSNTFNVVGVIA